MHDDDQDYSRRSARYKKKHDDAFRRLYGAVQTEDGAEPPQFTQERRSKRVVCNPTEYQEQASLVAWARLKRLPLIAIPNHGKRSYWQGQKEVKAGLYKGVSDLFLAKPNGKFSGYWIEMKSKGRKPTVEQVDWLNSMRAQGYAADWFDNWELARDSIIEYLQLSS